MTLIVYLKDCNLIEDSPQVKWKIAIILSNDWNNVGFREMITK